LRQYGQYHDGPFVCNLIEKRPGRAIGEKDFIHFTGHLGILLYI
jgi:hypothetical protein